MGNERGRERQKEMAKSAATGLHEMHSAMVLARREGELKTTTKNNSVNTTILDAFNRFYIFGDYGVTEADL